MNKKVKKIVAVMLCIGIIICSPGITEAAGTATEKYNLIGKVNTISEYSGEAKKSVSENETKLEKATDSEKGTEIQRKTDTEKSTTEINKTPLTEKNISNTEKKAEAAGTDKKTQESKDSIKETTKESSKDSTKESTKESTTDSTTETTKESATDSTTDNATESAKDSTKETQSESKENQSQASPVLYWDPSADADKNTDINSRDGKSAQTPLTNIEDIFSKAADLKKLPGDEVTVYVMSSMKINASEKVEFDGRGIRFVNWAERKGEDQSIFLIEEGGAVLSNMTLASAAGRENQTLIRVTGGSLVIGVGLNVQGNLELDYRNSQGKKPSIQILKELEKGRTYTISVQADANVNEEMALSALYENGESGDSLLSHFTLEQSAKNNWKLWVKEDTAKEIYLTLLSKTDDKDTTKDTTKDETKDVEKDVSKVSPKDEDKTDIKEPENNTENKVRSSARAVGSQIVYWNVNKDASSPEGDRPAIPGGNDGNSGIDDQHPVQSWEKAKELLGGEGGTVIVMSPVVVGDPEFTQNGVPITELDGENKIALSQWEKYPTEVLIIPPGETFKMSNIDVACKQGIGIRIAGSYDGASGDVLGKLVIGEGMTITGGSIQTELDPEYRDRLADCTIELAADPGNRKFNVYFSGLDDNQVYQYADVIMGPAGSDASDYLDAFVLHSRNQNAGWGLRKDTYEDSDGVFENHIELYRKFVFTGVYLNGQKGNDAWFGGNCNWPVKTFAQAKKILLENWDEIAPENRVIYICDTVDITGTEVWNFIDDSGKDRSSEAKITCCKTNTDYTTHHKTVPGTLVSVKDGGNLTTSSLLMEYDYKNNSNIMINVLPGGTYTSEDGTVLRGFNSSYLGIGVQVQGASGKETRFTMNGGTITRKSLGVSVTGVNKNDTIFTLNGGSITDNSGADSGRYGAGVYVSNAQLDMTGGTINSNLSLSDYYKGFGGGIYAAGSNSILNISGGSITNNEARGTGATSGSSSSYNSYGAGIYITGGELNVSGTAVISDNTGTGYYVYGGGVYLGSGVKMVMDGGKISGNKAIGTSSSSRYGGGIYSTGGNLTIKGGIIENNTNTYYGGGVYSTAGSFSMSGGTIQGNESYYGGGLYLNGGYSSSRYSITGSVIQKNSSQYGGGIYTSNSYLDILQGVEIKENNAVSSGGGLYISGNTIKVTESYLKDNTAQYGGGVCTIGGVIYLEDTEVSGNQATENGGGFFNNGGTSYIGTGSSLTNNTAVNQGSSCYISSAMWFLGGTYDSKNTEAGKFGIYLDISTTSSYRIYIDPEALDMKDKIFLNTATSKLYLLEKVPVTGSEGKMPLYLNKNAFEVGSVVVTPAKYGAVNVIDKTYTYSNIQDAEPYVSYFTGGEIPPKTQLGGFNKNIILVGEGVYLDGTNGSDSNAGTSPSNAVLTFEKAKDILKDRIAEAKINAQKAAGDPGYDPDGFEPYIYICGEVRIPADAGDQKWELDYEAEEFVQSDTTNSQGNVINTNLAQVKRFASYYGVMARLLNNGSGKFTVGKLLMDGNAGAVDGANNTIQAMIYLTSNTSLILENTILQNNYSFGVESAGGSILMKGLNPDQSDGAVIRWHGNWAVRLLSGGTLTMQDHSGIENYRYLNNDSSQGNLPGLNSSTGGIGIQGDNSKAIMNDSSYILAPGRYGAGLLGRTTVSDTPMLEMNQDSSILQSDIGIYLYAANNVASLHDNARILKSSRGVYATLVSKSSRFNMDGNSAIINENKDYGIYLYNITATNSDADNLSVVLDGNAKIEGSSYGVYGNSSYAINNTSIILRGKSRIGKNSYGIYFDYCTTSTSTAVRPKIILEGNAVIGGTSRSEANSNYGIWSKRSCAVEIKDSAKVSNNGSYGIYLERYKTTSSSYYTGPSSILMSGDASVNDNGNNGIFNDDYLYTSSGITTIYPNEIEMTLEGTAKVINNQGKGIIVGSKGTLTLKDGIEIKGNRSTSIGNAVDCAGKLNLGGKAEVSGEIYIQDVNKPVTLLSEPDNQKFNIGCSDNFIGQVLVEPDTALTAGADPFIDNFIKTANFPKDKSIKARTPNLIVQGENNVYLAGQGALTPTLVPGNDSNNGGSRGAPVATFAKAAEILKTLDAGASIIICNYPVDFYSSSSAKPQGDTWSFDEGGSFTNDKGDTWKPKVLRDEQFFGHMIQLGGSAVFTVKNITIDGNKENIPLNTAISGSIINVNSSSAVVNLEQGAYLQNNRKTNSNEGGAAILNSGNVNIKGGGIVGNECYGLSSSYAYAAGIYNYGKVIMTSGHIDDNVNRSASYSYGVGVYNYNVYSTFEFSGGTISGNRTEKITSTISGTAFYNAGTLNMSGSAAITGNISDSSSYSANIMGTVFNNGTITVNGGIISDNELIYNGTNTSPTYGAQGGGIFVNSGQVTINGAEIQNNICRALRTESTSTSYSKGGAISVVGGTLKFLSGNIRGNKANRGAGIYYYGSSSKVDVAGGVIRDNIPLSTAIPAEKINAGIYIEGPSFNLKGGGSVISDRIYLSSTSYPLVLGGSIYQRNRKYMIDCSGSFQKGSVVVKADNDVILDATGYLAYFTTQVAGYVLEKQAPNLVLKQCVYIDSEKGSDSNNGANPDRAVKTMAKAISLGGGNNYVIYASGPIEVNKQETWDLPDTAWISRYTGFPIYGAGKEWAAYTGPVVRAAAGADLRLENIRILGRREIDDVIEGDSLIRIDPGASVSMNTDTKLRLNNLPAGKTGGAVNNNGGTLTVNGGTIQDVSALKGSAVYQGGSMSIAGSSTINGEVYLTGSGADEAASSYISADETYKPVNGTVLKLNMDNPYGGRRVIEYPAGAVPDSNTKKYFSLDSSILAIYHLENRSSDKNILELQQKGVVYLNGESGDDSEDGKTPKKAVRTLERAYEILKAGAEGGVITIVGKVTVDDEIKMNNINDSTGAHGYYENVVKVIDAKGPVYFQRYARPDAWEEWEEERPEKDQYKTPTYTGVMIEIAASGKLTVDNVYFDGHSQEVVGNPLFAAGKVEAGAPIFQVKGSLIIPAGATIYRNHNTAADAKSAGVYVDGGTFQAVSVEISDVKTPNGKGSAIYQDGTCILDRAPKIEGTVHLTGSGSIGNTASSKFIEISLRGFKPVNGELQITMDDPYLGRPLVQYPGRTSTQEPYEPTLEEASMYQLERSVTDIYSKGSRTGEVNMLELQFRRRVYIDGVNGDDDTNSGGLPNDAVRTLKKAYELLKNIGGGYLYVVDTVSVDKDISLSSTSYSEAGSPGEISIIGGSVDIRRYVVPDAMKANPNFSSPGSHTKELFKVKEGSSLSLQQILIDGHRLPVASGDPMEDVAEATKSEAPLIITETRSTLNLNEGTILEHNDNTLSSNGKEEGGAIANHGNLNLDGAVIKNNSAGKGAGIYQDGYFTIVYGAARLANQEIYLTTENTGTQDNPVWGADRVIHIQEKLNASDYLDIGADNPVNGRDIAVYDIKEAYEDAVDDEYYHYKLGTSITSVNPALYLVESTTENDTLELYNYEIMDISVPLEVCLAAVENPLQASAKNKNIRNASLDAPDYTITNGGKYKTKVTVVAFRNDNHTEGITWDQMILVGDETELTGSDLDKKLYLAVAGADQESSNGFAGLSESALSKANTTPIEFGELEAGASGKFTFKGTADTAFFEKYNDTLFGTSYTEPDTYVKENARAKYQMVYKFELVR